MHDKYSPSTKQNVSMARNTWSPNLWARVSSIVHTPIDTKETCNICFLHLQKIYIYEGDLLQHDPVAVPLDGGQVGEEAGAESAEAGADADAHDQLARLLTVPHAVLVQGDLFGELGLNKTKCIIEFIEMDWVALKQ